MFGAIYVFGKYPCQYSEEMDPVALTPDGGLKKIILREGSGECPPINSKVQVHYVGTLHPSGQKFDSSRDRKDFFNFTLGINQVIKGWDIGVASMKVGELCELYCEPMYGYGAAGAPPSIPPNSVLKFEVELFGFEVEPTEPLDILEYAEQLKLKGNQALKQENPLLASQHYQKALSKITTSCEKDEQIGKAIITLKCNLLVNMALAKYKLNAFGDSETFAKQALKIDATNEKAIYRLAAAQNGQCNYDVAIDTLKEGLSQDCLSKSESLHQLLLVSNGLKKQAKEAEKKMYSKMFP